MGTSPTHHDGGNLPPSTSTVVLLLGTIADTTWRMFLPIIGLTFLGWYVDKLWMTKPWLMLVGIIVGSVIAGVLIKRQLSRVRIS